jgi:hypothetical protein
MTCGVFAIALSTTAASTISGCTTHQCDPNSYDYVDGFMQDPDTFVTTALNDRWLTYNGNTTIRVWFPKVTEGRVPIAIIGQVGVGGTPNGGPLFGGDAFAPGDDWTSAVGQLAVYDFLNTLSGPVEGELRGGGFWVTNETCADYVARFTVQFSPFDGGDPGTASPAPPPADTTPDPAGGDAQSDAEGEGGSGSDAPNE